MADSMVQQKKKEMGKSSEKVFDSYSLSAKRLALVIKDNKVRNIKRKKGIGNNKGMKGP